MPHTTGNIETEVLVRMSVSTTSAFITDTILDNWLDRAHKWTAGYKKWPMTEGKSSTTFASLVTNEESNLEGEVPEGWKSDSVRLLLIDGKRVKRRAYEDFFNYREHRTDGDKRIFTNFGRLYFINPNIDISGTVTSWGQFTPADFDTTDTSARTVFSDTEEGNEAIIEKMLSYAMLRAKKKEESKAHHDDAKEILDGIWERITAEQYQDGTESGGMFEWFDIVADRRRRPFFREDQFLS